MCDLHSPPHWQCSLHSWRCQTHCLQWLTLVLQQPPAAGPFCPDRPAALSGPHRASQRRSTTKILSGDRQRACRPTEDRRKVTEGQRLENRSEGQAERGTTSLMLTSASTYWRPFWMMLMRAAGGTRAPLMLD